MSAYLIATIHLSNPEQYKRYVAATPEVIARFGGRFLVRGGRSEVMEGAWLGERNVVIEFPDYDTAQRFYHSPEYGKAKAERIGAADFNAVIVDGV